MMRRLARGKRIELELQIRMTGRDQLMIHNLIARAQIYARAHVRARIDVGIADADVRVHAHVRIDVHADRGG